MSIRIMSEVWNLPLVDSQKLILLALADYANDEGLCWPSMATLSAKCGKGERTVQRVVKELVEAGHLTRDELTGRGCKYIVHPRNHCAPATVTPRNDDTPPPQPLRPTPATVAPKPSITIKEPSDKKTRAHELPADWNPEPFTVGTKSREVVDEWPPGTFDETLEAFRAHHQARGGKFKDWQQAWSTWVLNSRKFSNGRKPQQHRANRSSAREIGERIAHELASKTSAAANW